MAEFYARVDEAKRLTRGTPRLELERVRDLLKRYLPEAPTEIADVGGGTGRHAVWLAGRGYQVRLVDVVVDHVRQARQAATEAGVEITAEVGDARSLDLKNASVDAVLMIGPLYHLTARAERLRALAEARRVLRPDGVLFAVAVSRFSSLLDGYHYGVMDDPAFREIVTQDLTDGQHRNPAKNPEYFTDTFFHLPEELEVEVDEAGFERRATVGVQGPFRLLGDLAERWDDLEWRGRLLGYLRRIEEERSLLGASGAIMTIARRSS